VPHAPRSKRRLGAALQQALTGKLAVHPTAEDRAPGAGLLSNEMRARVFQCLLDRPMSHTAALARSCRLRSPSVRWHLKALSAAGLVQSARTSREVRYFVVGTVDETSRAVLAVLRGRRALPVLSAVVQTPGLSIRELAAHAGGSSQAVLRAREPLLRLGLIEGQREGRETRSYPADELSRFLARRTTGLPGAYARVESALVSAGERPQVTHRAKGEIAFHVGRRGSRREFQMRADAPLRPEARARLKFDN
jgi:DNA-binding transcriptional ArsR family regulator